MRSIRRYTNNSRHWFASHESGLHTKFHDSLTVRDHHHHLEHSVLKSGLI